MGSDRHRDGDDHADDEREPCAGARLGDDSLLDPVGVGVESRADDWSVFEVSGQADLLERGSLELVIARAGQAEGDPSRRESDGGADQGGNCDAAPASTAGSGIGHHDHSALGGAMLCQNI